MLYAKQSGKSGPALVFLHGVGGDHRCFAPQIAHFAPTHRVYAVDLPGYGRTDALADMTMANLADAVMDWIDATLDAPPHLVGHSFGGMVAQELVAHYPSGIRSLNLSGTSPAFGSKDGAFQKKFVSDRTKPLDEGKTLADLAPVLVPGLLGANPHPDAAPAMIETMSAVPPATYRQAIAAIVGFDRRENLPKIKVPTLCIAGDEDRTAPPAMMERMAGNIPNAEFSLIEGAGHLANLERPDEFNETLAAFLNKL